MITRTHESDGTGTVAGRLSGVRLQSPGAPAYRLDYGYDAFGRHSTFTSHHGDTQRTATYGWIPDSHLLAGIDHGGLLHTTYRYEPHRDVKTAVSNWVAGVGGQPNRNLSTYAHDYSPDRRRVNVVNTGEAFAQAAFNLFDYNARNEVVRSLRHLGSDTTQTNNEVAAEARRYEYDPIGNRLLSESAHSNLTTYLSNELNQYTNTTESGVSNKIHHDPDGNLTNDARFAYEWNGENRLVTATPVTPTNGAKQVRNDYDHQGRRWRKRVFTFTAATWTLTETRTFVYDAWNPIQETVQTTTTEHLHYDWGLDLSLTLQAAGGVGGLLRLHHYAGSSTNTHRLLHDANGTVGQLIDASGQFSARYEYDPFGNNTIRATSLVLFKLQFSTKYFDYETELVYYGCRFYSPLAGGKWLSRDPIGEAGGENLYAATINDHVNVIDIIGLENLVTTSTGWVIDLDDTTIINGVVHYSATRGRTGYWLSEDVVQTELKNKIDDTDLVMDAVRAALSTCFLRCYLLDLTEETMEEIMQIFSNELPVQESQAFRDWVAKLPGDTAARFLTVTSLVLGWSARKPQGIGLVPKNIGRILNNRRILVALRKKIRNEGIKLVGKGGTKVFGRIGSKCIPVIGWIGLGYEGVKACNCVIACKDGRYTDDEKLF